MELVQRDGTTYLYDDVSNHGISKKRKKGYFLMYMGGFYFQFAGQSFKMTGSKKYDASLKLIDVTTKTWIAVNKDRKGRRCNIGDNFFRYAMEAYKLELINLIAEE